MARKSKAEGEVKGKARLSIDFQNRPTIVVRATRLQPWRRVVST